MANLLHTFKDGDIENYMDKEKAERIGYRRVIDVQATILLNRPNKVIEKYAKAELREDPSVFDSITTLLGNFFFLLRVITYQIVLCALPHAP